MVPEEDCPLQECKCAELPYQVGNKTLKCYISFNHNSGFPHMFFNHFFTLFCSLALFLSFFFSFFLTYLLFKSSHLILWLPHTFSFSSCGSVGRTAWLCVPSSIDTDLTSLTTPNWERYPVFSSCCFPSFLEFALFPFFELNNQSFRLHLFSTFQTNTVLLHQVTIETISRKETLETKQNLIIGKHWLVNK